MNEVKIEHITDGHGDRFEITDRAGHHVTMDPQEALLVLQFLYERVDEITRLVNDLPSEPLLQECKYCGQYHESHLIEQCPLNPARARISIGDDHESIETHLQELSEAENRQAEGEE